MLELDFLDGIIEVYGCQHFLVNPIHPSMTVRHRQLPDAKTGVKET